MLYPGDPVIKGIVRPRQFAKPTLYFIGVTTTQSSIMKIFPRWMEQLKRPEVVIQGVDLKLHDDRENYRAAVAQIK